MRRVLGCVVTAMMFPITSNAYRVGTHQEMTNAAVGRSSLASFEQ